MALRVAREVEVELGDGLLEHAPHRLAEVGHEAHQAEVALVVGSHLAEVGAQQLLDRRVLELVVAREVGEVEEDVAHPRVLPVDDPDPAAVVDEVRVQEIVVTRALGDVPSRAFDLVCDLAGVRVGRWGRDPVRHRALSIDLDDAERVESGRDGLPRMDGAKRLRDPPERVRRPHRLGRHARPFDEPGHEVALGLDELDHLRPHPDRGGRQRCLVLGAPVDPEQVRVATGDPQHVRPVVEHDLEVVVRDPAAEHLDRRQAAGPHSLHDLVDAHRRRS